ncbi:MAG: lytic transglycosylase domain-containing protein [Pseudomonadota bacterium]
MLRNGVKAGDRSGLHLRKVPRPGTPRLHPTSPVRQTAPQTAALPPLPRPTERLKLGQPRRSAPRTHAWFWQNVSHTRAAASPARFEPVLETLRTRRKREGVLYDAAWIERLRRTWQRPITAAAQRHGVSEALILAMIAVESAGKPRARSHAGAQGLMQLIPATARRFGVRDVYDPMQNVAGGAAYMNWLLGRFDGDVVLALAGYNAGEGAVDKHAGVPPYRETRGYVVKVLDALVAAEGLCGGRASGPRQRCGWGAE